MSKAQANYVKNFFNTPASHKAGKFFGLDGSWLRNIFVVEEEGITIEFCVSGERLGVQASCLDNNGNPRKDTQTNQHFVSLDGSFNIVDHILTVISYLKDNTTSLIRDLEAEVKYINNLKVSFTLDPKDELKEILEFVDNTTLDKLKTFKNKHPAFDPTGLDQMILGLSVINNFR